MEAAIVVIVILAVAGLLFGIAGHGARKTLLTALANELHGQATSNSASGLWRQVAATIAFETRGSGSSSERWTYVDCTLPAGYPFVLHVERHGWFDAGKIARGEMVDVVVGDPAFDDAFRVEGAPAEVVRRVLVPEARGYLLGVPRCELTTRDTTLRLAVRGWLDDRERAVAALDAAAAIAGRVREASLALDAEVPMVHDGPAYRAIASDAPLQAARAARAAEVDAVASLRASRLAGQRVIMVLILVAVVVTFLALAAD